MHSIISSICYRISAAQQDILLSKHTSCFEDDYAMGGGWATYHGTVIIVASNIAVRLNKRSFADPDEAYGSSDPENWKEFTFA